jgi:hypothetical protein
LNRLYRLLRNPRVDELLRLLGAGRRLRIALDGTEWHHDLKMRVASGDPGPGGSLRKTPIFRSQNGWEHTFLRLLVHTLREVGQTAVLPCDRGSHRVSGFQLLLERKQSFAGSPALPPRAGGRPPAGQGRPSPGPRGLGPRAGRTLVCSTPWRTWWPWMTGAWVSEYPGRPLRRSSAPPSTQPASPSSWGPPSGRPSVRLPCKPKAPRLSLLRVGIGPAESS